MTFEQKRIAEEKHAAIQARISERFALIVGKPTPNELVKIVNDAVLEQYPEPEGLTYEYNEEFS